MNSRLYRFFQGFSFKVNYSVLKYLAVYAAALAGAIIGACISRGDVTYVILFGAGFYIIGSLISWAKNRV